MKGNRHVYLTGYSKNGISRAIHVFLRAFLVGLFFATGLTAQVPGPNAETKEQREARMAWWKEARFGLFIHWGLYAIPAGVWQELKTKHPFLGTEWLFCYDKVPIDDYKKLANQFDPVKFNAEEWVQMAQNAGMKYIVLTAKHHEGFALFKSGASDFNVVDATPFKRDIVKEMAEACQKHGMKLGLYYSQAQDWSHPGGAVSSFMKPWDPALGGDFNGYVDRIAIPQVKEILSNYGPISIIWWDTPEGMTPEIAAKFRETLSLQPGILQNNRLGKNEPGDFKVQEGGVPITNVPGTPWETCAMMNGSWGHSSVHDKEWRSAKSLLHELIQVSSLGGNYLLNVGPTAEGIFPTESVERLKTIGTWMKVNGDAIHGSSPSPLRKIWQQGRMTRKPGKLYVHVFLWPDGGKLTIPVIADVKKIYLLADSAKALPFVASEKGLQVEVPVEVPDPFATVVVLDVEGKISEVPFPPLSAGDGGNYDLLATYAAVKNAQGAKPVLALGKREGVSPPLTGDVAEAYKLGGFSQAGDEAVWEVDMAKPGRYEVVAYYGLHKNTPDGAALTVKLGDQVCSGILPVTGDAQTFKPLSLGVLEIKSPGVFVLTASAVLPVPPGSPGMSLWRVQLIRKD